MASLIPGYEYDIFISYRQKDNKYDGWVTEFVDNLRRELEATFKEDISVYFDINPHDGLLETHDVDASLKEKLKCLVFIPIISRTYCDPKSFAWEHEFKAFIEQASQDQFGLKVKLSSGNIANRVLPVQIHDLNTDDKTIVEKELGGFLRAIEFIYKELGVNKPLSDEDDEKKNLNNTKYRIQINKVANTIDEIISGLRNFQKAPAKEEVLQRLQQERDTKEKVQVILEKPLNKNRLKLFSGIAIIIILIITAILVFPKIFKQNKLEKLRSADGRISVAVMPFQNITHDTIWNDWQSGIQTSLINSLSNDPEEFKVIQVEPIKGLIQSKELTDYASITPSLASSISKTLEADYVICGSINKAGATTRLNAQLINSNTEEIIKTFERDGPSGEEMIIHLIDSLRKSIKDYLIITILKKEVMTDISPYVVTNSPSALKYFSRGEGAFYSRDYVAAIKYFSLSFEADSNFASAIFYLSLSYYQIGRFQDAKKWYSKLDKKREEQMSVPIECWIGWLKGAIYGQPYEGIKSLRHLEKIDD